MSFGARMVAVATAESLACEVTRAVSRIIDGDHQATVHLGSVGLGALARSREDPGCQSSPATRIHGQKEFVMRLVPIVLAVLPIIRLAGVAGAAPLHVSHCSVGANSSRVRAKQIWLVRQFRI